MSLRCQKCGLLVAEYECCCAQCALLACGTCMGAVDAALGFKSNVCSLVCAIEYGGYEDTSPPMETQQPPPPASAEM